MKLIIGLVIGKNTVFENEDALAVEVAIDRAIKLGEQATNNIKLADGRSYRVFINSIVETIIEY